MTDKELDNLKIRCGNLEKSYREGYPETVKRARREGAEDCYQRVIAEMKHWDYSSIYVDDEGTTIPVYDYLSTDEVKGRILDGEG